MPGAKARAAGGSHPGLYGDWGGAMAAGMPADADGLRATVQAFEEVGTDELIFNPTDGDLRQLEGLARAVLGRS